MPPLNFDRYDLQMPAMEPNRVAMVNAAADEVRNAGAIIEANKNQQIVAHALA